MKLMLISVVVVLSFAATANAAKLTSGYYKKNGTYVAPHYKTAPDSSRYNNFSTKGNTNPYTGKKGYKSPYKY